MNSVPDKKKVGKNTLGYTFFSSQKYARSFSLYNWSSSEGNKFGSLESSPSDYLQVSQVICWWGSGDKEQRWKTCETGVKLVWTELYFLSQAAANKRNRCLLPATVKMPPKVYKYAAMYTMVEEILHTYVQQLGVAISYIPKATSRKRLRNTDARPFNYIERIPNQVKHLDRLVGVTDTDCIVNLRMDRNAFGRLCIILRELGGLSDGKYVTVEEQVAMFLCILAHHKKNRVVGFDFWRSGQTISFYVHVVLRAVILLFDLFLAKPSPVPEDCTNPRWMYFKGCLGALDGTCIHVMVSSSDKPRYRTRKGDICTNTLAACDRELRWVYVLPGWEGSAADSRVLRDAITREHGLKVPKGHYYLCDNGYANSEGFLTPYNSVRYHLREWGPENQRPVNAQEMFNMRHSKARNVVERAFGVMKIRWGILRSASFYPAKVQNRLIMACFLLHNFIRNEMNADPIEDLVDSQPLEEANEDQNVDEEYIAQIESTPEWNRTRDDIAQSVWNE